MSSISARFPTLFGPTASDAAAAQPQIETAGEEGSTFRALMDQSLRKTSLNGLRTDERHIAQPAANAVDKEFDQRALNILSQRQQVIASNIANADTPHYKARGFDLQDAMREANRYQVAPLAMATTAASHQAGSVQRTAQALALKYELPTQGSVDGNTVEMDTERANFAENTIRFQFALNQIREDGRDTAQWLSQLKD